MSNNDWRHEPPQQAQVHIEPVYDRTTGRELIRAEAGCAKEIERLQRVIERRRQQLSYATHVNVRLGEKLAISESIVSEMRRQANLSQTANPYPTNTKYTSEYLNTELADFCASYGIQLGFPKEFLCPITYEVMAYPVTTSQGHTYEWKNITKWINDGNNKDPITNNVLSNFILYPNHELRSLILSFIRNCELIINELRKKEGLKETQRSIRMRSAPAEYGTRSKLYVKPNISTRSILSTKTRTKSRAKSSSKSRALTTAKDRARETAPSSSTYDPNFRQQLG